ncbi:hypothetical protein FOA52_007368 [Chlamydomonas sp. UWO 241]|nr:hypothetical protein FOA52_007368 [Chlamydomonas sp. UWO 241]
MAFTYTEAQALWYLHLTAQQESAYDSFRAHLDSTGALLPGHDDKYTLLRFLKARQWDTPKATLMYTGMVAWRKKEDVDGLYNSLHFPELDAVLPVYPHFYHKLDKFGRPVYIEQVGKTDCAKILSLTSEEKIVKYHIWTWERFFKQLAPACSEMAGKPIITCTVIIDLEGLGLSNFSTAARKLLTLLSHIDQDYYPESLGVMFIINTPFIFKTIWAFVNPMLEERTRKKIHVLGMDYQKTLAEVIDHDSLLECFGGASRGAPSKVSDGPWVSHPMVTASRWLPDDLPEPTKLSEAASLPEPAADNGVTVTAGVPHSLSDAR